jgi:LPS-assembly protein
VDVALGATNVPFPRELLSFWQYLKCSRKSKRKKQSGQEPGSQASSRLRAIHISFSILVLFAGFAASATFGSRSAFAVSEEKALHTSGDRSLWDRKNNRVTLIGHAVVRQENETLSADEITLDFTTRMLDAKGNCVYITIDSIVYGDEMHLNLDTRTGVIVGARVSNERFTLAGERINKLGDRRFQVHWGEYSTCKDCPNSWSIEAEDVDITFEGYAYMSNVTTRIKDAPAFWLPYLILPIKTQRQTGFLFPTYHISRTDGFAFVEPFFWAINRSSDMTFGVGDYTARGTRLEWEGRYALSPRSGGIASFDYVHDRSFVDPAGQSIATNRWSLNVLQTQELPFGIDEKLKYIDVSDNKYPIDLANDVYRGDNLVLPSSLIFNYGTSDLSAFLAFDRYRNVIDTNSDPILGQTEFDPTTVQVYPTAVATTNDRFIFGTPVAAGLTFGVTNFTRSAGFFDTDYGHQQTAPGANLPYDPGVDPLREATRVAITPSLYTTLRPFDVLIVIPSATYYSYFYSFHNAQTNNLNRGYLLLQLDLSTQLEKIWDTPDPDRPRQKSLIRPMLTYSNIPSVRESDPNHPFLRQIQYAQDNNFSGYNFDDYDIVPVSNSPSQVNYFTPLGNSLSYGLSTQLITRYGALDKPDPFYIHNVELTAGQSVNFKEFQKAAEQRQPLSRFFATMDIMLDRITSSSTYYYYPYVPTPRNFLSTTETYIFERALHQRVLTYDRSISLTYVYDRRTCSENSCGTSNINSTINFSLSDYIMPSAYSEFSFISHQLNRAGAGLTFQSPAQCYKFAVNVDYTIQNREIAYSFDLSLNITGTGFGGLTGAGGLAPTAATTPGAPGMIP